MLIDIKLKPYIDLIRKLIKKGERNRLKIFAKLFELLNSSINSHYSSWFLWKTNLLKEKPLLKSISNILNEAKLTQNNLWRNSDTIYLKTIFDLLYSFEDICHLNAKSELIYLCNAYSIFFPADLLLINDNAKFKKYILSFKDIDNVINKWRAQLIPESCESIQPSENTTFEGIKDYLKRWKLDNVDWVMTYSPEVINSLHYSNKIILRDIAIKKLQAGKSEPSSPFPCIDLTKITVVKLFEFVRNLNLENADLNVLFDEVMNLLSDFRQENLLKDIFKTGTLSHEFMQIFANIAQHKIQGRLTNAYYHIYYTHRSNDLYLLTLLIHLCKEPNEKFLHFLQTDVFDFINTLELPAYNTINRFIFIEQLRINIFSKSQSTIYKVRNEYLSRLQQATTPALINQSIMSLYYLFKETKDQETINIIAQHYDDLPDYYKPKLLPYFSEEVITNLLEDIYKESTADTHFVDKMEKLKNLYPYLNPLQKNQLKLFLGNHIEKVLLFNNKETLDELASSELNFDEILKEVDFAEKNELTQYILSTRDTEGDNRHFFEKYFHFFMYIIKQELPNLSLYLYIKLSTDSIKQVWTNLKFLEPLTIKLSIEFQKQITFIWPTLLAIPTFGYGVAMCANKILLHTIQHLNHAEKFNLANTLIKSLNDNFIEQLTEVIHMLAKDFTYPERIYLIFEINETFPEKSICMIAKLYELIKAQQLIEEAEPLKEAPSTTVSLINAYR